MLNKCAFANSFAVLTAALDVLFPILALEMPPWGALASGRQLSA
jgi:hypothetical protein